MTILQPEYNWAYNPGNRSETTQLILHHAAADGDALEVHKWHLAKSWAGIAYHYYVRKDGSVYRGRPEEWNGGHTTGFNSTSIGVCFEGNFEIEDMSQTQKDAGRALVTDILKRYPDLKVYGHKDLNATSCPGTKFPFNYITTPLEPEKPVDTKEIRYQTIAEIPVWAKPTIEKLMANGSLNGTGVGLDLSHDIVRLLVIGDRNGIYKEKI